jgi:glycosyltransferase involved in cell wall biosynthesis
VSAAVDVIVPAYGPSPWLAEALDSALAQDPAPAAVIVVDDASPAPLALEARHAGRCVLVRRERNGGPAAARASGLERSDAPLVALLDADDAWEPGKVAAQLDALAAAPDAGVCFGSATVVDEGGSPTGEEFAAVEPGVHAAADMARLLFRRNPIPTSSAILRRSAVDASGGFDHPETDDLGSWLRLALGGSGFVFEPRARIRYRRHAGGLSGDLRVGAGLALAALDAHGHVLDPQERRELRRDWLALSARGEFRARRYAAGRDALRRASREAPLAPRERALAAVAAVPLARSALGRRAPRG